MPPAMESQMLRGVPSRKRSLLEKRCTMAKPPTASMERTATKDMLLDVPLQGCFENGLRAAPELTEPSPARPLEANLARPGRSQQEITPGGGSEEWGLLFYKTQT